MTIDLGKDQLKDVFISPEGVEERIVNEQKFMITQTQGGKYRVYISGSGGEYKPHPGIHNDEEAARQEVAFAMGMMGSMVISPKETIKSLVEMLKKPK